MDRGVKMNGIYELWESRFKVEVNEKQYWERMIKFLLMDGELEKGGAHDLLEFINCRTTDFIFCKEIMLPEEIKRRTKKVLDSLEWLQKRREEGEKAIKECTLMAFEKYRELKEKYGGNEAIYTEKFYQREKVYNIFFNILFDKCKIISEELEKKVRYQRYGKITSYRNYYNESPICDLIISNVYRGALYKKNPKNLCNKAKYVYEENGDLLIFIWYGEDGQEYLRVVYFQSGNYIYSFEYYGKERLDEVGVRKYENGKIIHSEWGRMGGEKIPFCVEAYSENYSYLDDELREAFLEEYHFPIYSKSLGNQLPGLLSRNQYFFEGDGQGFLKGYHIKEWWGDKIKKNSWDDKMLPLSEKKRKDTGKDAGRWQRPNYFIE